MVVCWHGERYSARSLSVSLAENVCQAAPGRSFCGSKPGTVYLDLVQTLEYNWIVGQLAKFTSLRKLVMVIDEDYADDIVTNLFMQGIAEETWGSWTIPKAIVETLEDIKIREPDLRLPIPEVRVMDDIKKVLDPGTIEVCLRCNPCEYLNARR
jgi:hypothetical protein